MSGLLVMGSLAGVQNVKVPTGTGVEYGSLEAEGIPHEDSINKS